MASKGRSNTKQRGGRGQKSGGVTVRVPIKSQRKVATATKAKKGPKTQQSKNGAPIVGVSTLPLSSRFAGLHNQVPSTTTKKVNGTQQKKTTQVMIKKQELQKKQQKTNKANRQQVVSKHRKGLQQTDVPAKSKPRNPPTNASRGRGRGRGSNVKKSTKPEDLDMEMDSYWHAAGKGPDPKQAQLDRQMEDYWAGKPKEEDSNSTMNVEA